VIDLSPLAIIPSTQGLYISLRDRGNILKKLKAWQQQDLKVVVATDGERILGLGESLPAAQAGSCYCRQGFDILAHAVVVCMCAFFGVRLQQTAHAYSTCASTNLTSDCMLYVFVPRRRPGLQRHGYQ
jgi:hypothetical protein